MLWRDVADLVKIDRSETDVDGYPIEREVSRKQVFVDVGSVRRNEFYTAKEAGTHLAMAFLVRAADYSGEERIEYKHHGDKNKTAYRVIREYSKAGEIVELNCALDSLPGSVARKAGQGQW